MLEKKEEEYDEDESWKGSVHPTVKKFNGWYFISVSLCAKGHEILFDKRNYRKLYDCYKSDYCDIGELCPYKHPIDINVEEIYLPEKEKEIIKEKLEEIKKNDNEIQFLKSEYLKDFECIICKRYDITSFYIYDKCGHIICEKCLGNITECPECEDLDNTPILIDLNINP